MDPNLYSAIKYSNTTEFHKAVEKNANSLDARTKKDDTVLHLACKFGRAAMVELILGQRSDMVSSRNVYGETPIHTACIQNNLQILKMLMESNQWVAADVDNNGRSPLYIAIFYNRVLLVEYLLKYRWIPSSDEDGCLCLHIAISRKCTDIHIVSLLLEAHPSLVLKVDGNGNTALHVAVSNRHFREAGYLIRNTRVDVDARNIEGKTAFDIVAGYGSHDIASRHLHTLLADNQSIPDFPVEEFDSSSPNFPSHDQQDDCKKDGRENEDEIHPEEELASSASDNVGLEQKLKSVRRRKSLDNGREDEELTSRASDNVGLEQHKLKSMRRRKKLEKLYKKQKQEKVHERRLYQEAVQNARNTVVIVAVLIATVAFQAGVSPPGGVNDAGKSVLARTTAFKVFIVSNTAALSISLGIVIVLVSFIPFKRKPLVRILKYSHRAMWVAVSFMAIAFIASSWATLPSYPHDKETKWMKAVLVVGAGGGLGAVFLGWSVMLGTHLERKSKWRRTRILEDSKQEVNKFGNESEITGSAKSQADDAAKVVKRRLKEDFGNWNGYSSNSDVDSSNGVGYHPV